MGNRTLFLAYGNPDRQDDGAAWFALQGIADQFSCQISDYNDDFYARLGSEPDFFFILQLTPELNELIVKYDRVCFIDAHLGDEYGEVELRLIQPSFEPATLSHHMTPQFLLNITLVYQHTCPSGVLLTIKGHEFQFVQGLSARTKVLVGVAVDRAIRWFNGP